MRAGERVAGRYRLEARLGRGGMGEVWRGLDLELGRRVAVKMLLEFHEAGEALTRFRREAAIGAQFQHPGITVVHDIGQHDNRLFIVMELLEGEDLARVLARSPGGLSVGETVGLGLQVARALSVTHARGVVHRDLKPANLFRLTDGRVKICDFGIARGLQATKKVTRTGWMLGTPPYMAPEQWRGKDVDVAADMYALGCVLYELLTGAPPFPPQDEPLALMHQHLTEAPALLRTIRADIPEELQTLVVALLAKDPGDRPDASAAAELLSEVQASAAEPNIAEAQTPEAQTSEAQTSEAQTAETQTAETQTAESPPAPENPGGSSVLPTPEDPAADPPEGTVARGPRRRSLVFGGAAALTVFSGAAAVQLLLPSGRQPGSGAHRSSTNGSSPHPAGAPAQPQQWFTLTDGTNFLTSVAFSPDGRTIATGGNPVHIWDLTSRTAIRTLSSHSHGVFSVVFSPDGKTLACGDDAGVVQLWDVESGVNTAVLTYSKSTAGAADAIFSVAFSPDGTIVAGAADDNTIRLWESASRINGATLTLHSGEVSSVAFSPDGRTLASVGGENVIRLWQLATGENTATLTGHTDYVLSVAFSPDGKSLASGAQDRDVRLWDVGSATGIATLTGHADQVDSVAFHPDGRSLASAARDGTVRLWNVATHAGFASMPGSADHVESVAFSRDGTVLACAGSDGTIRLWKLDAKS